MHILSRRRNLETESEKNVGYKLKEVFVLGIVENLTFLR